MTDDPLTQRNCVGCGVPLIDLNPLWGMCSQCIEGTKEKLAIAIQRKDEERNPKRFQIHIPSLARRK